MDTDLPDYLKDALINSAGAETIPFLSRFPYKQCFLPRQARDKRKETQNRDPFLFWSRWVGQEGIGRLVRYTESTSLVVR